MKTGRGVRTGEVKEEQILFRDGVCYHGYCGGEEKDEEEQREEEEACENEDGKRSADGGSKRKANLKMLRDGDWY